MVYWSTKKQATVAQSSTEAEYRAVINCVAELTWLQQHLGDIDISVPCKPVVYCDKISTTYLALNPIFHAHTKHIKLDVHFVCEKVASGRLDICYLPTEAHIAYIFTKGFNTSRHKLMRINLSVVVSPPD